VCDLETSRIGAPYIYDFSSLRVNDLTLILLTWRILWAPNNPIWYLLALLGAHHIFHVSRIRVKQEPTHLSATWEILLFCFREMHGSNLCHKSWDPAWGVWEFFSVFLYVYLYLLCFVLFVLCFCIVSFMYIYSYLFVLV